MIISHFVTQQDTDLKSEPVSPLVGANTWTLTISTDATPDRTLMMLLFELRQFKKKNESKHQIESKIISKRVDS